MDLFPAAFSRNPKDSDPTKRIPVNVTVKTTCRVDAEGKKEGPKTVKDEFTDLCFGGTIFRRKPNGKTDLTFLTSISMGTKHSELLHLTPDKVFTEDMDIQPEMEEMFVSI